ncbi:hypothetical protein [Emticicia sp. W12TSBA100-4]|uniref:hypothetical protein n=1 Tax=Emticicia sp. W12TSBA100-4 TaxID=3160965 RepID=UPI00330684C7
MKKLLLICFFFTTCVIESFAQTPEGWTKEMWDEVVASKAFKLNLVSDKGLLEASESCMLSIEVTVPPKANPDDDTPELFRKSQTIKLPNGEEKPYKVTNWRIVEGGGNIITDINSATYTAPKSAPNGKKMIVSVELLPQSTNLPKVTLLKTIYFSENETFFTLHIPDLGIINAKFVTKIDGGIGKTANLNLPQAAIDAAKQKGYNINGLTANAMHIYDSNQNLSVLRFTGLALEAIDTDGDGSKNIANGNNILAIAYKGVGAGTFNLEAENSGVNMVVGTQLGVGCGDTNEDKFCTGSVIITHEDAKYIEGKINTIVYAGDYNGQIARGRLSGKFKAMRAN